ncbi:MAG: hypothetical protein EOM24_22490 [Chloroflexia bacterium]|nr:hypothetical protein [Chloroflexia bacterium]
MKQLLILSGKGGTGKTTVASAFIELGKNMEGTIVDASPYAIDNPSSVVVDATCNWWGQDTGPATGQFLHAVPAPGRGP